jgi:hypothetical protein
VNGHERGRWRPLRPGALLALTLLAWPVAGAGPEPPPAAPDAPDAAPRPGEGLRVAIRVQRLSDLGIQLPPGLDGLGPVRGSARLVVRGGVLRLEELDARVRADGAELAIEGAVADAASWKGLDLNFRFTADSPGWFARGAEASARGPFALSGRLASAGATVNLTDLVMTSPGSRVTGTLAFTPAAGRPRLIGTLQAETLDLDELLPGRDTQPGEDGPLFSDATLPLEALTGLDAQLTLSAGLLRLGGLELTDTTSVLAGDASATRLMSAGKHAGGRYDGTLTLTPGDGATETAAALTLEGVSWEEATRQLGIEDYVDGGPTDARLDVRGRGLSVRAIMATLNGELRMRAGRSRIFNVALDRAGLDVLELMVDLFTPGEDRLATTDIECAALALDIRDGVGRAENGLVVLTSKVVMAGSGAVDLRDETLALALDLEPREGLSFSGTSLAGSATVAGPLTAPEVSASATGIARTAASLAGALATGGLSLVGEKTLSLAGAAENPCSAALQEGTGTGVSTPAAGGAVESATGVITKGVGGVGEGLKKLLGQ